MVRAQAKGHDTHEHSDQLIIPTGYGFICWLVGCVGGWLIFSPYSNMEVASRADESALGLEKTG